MCVFGCSKKKLCAIYGKWTECLYTVDCASFDAHKKTDRKNSDDKRGNKQVFSFTAFKITYVVPIWFKLKGQFIQKYLFFSSYL